MEYRSGVESNFGVSKILITPAYSVWAQCILWSGVLEQSCGVVEWSQTLEWQKQNGDQL